MRPGRLIFILLAIYLVFLGGSAYYNLIFPVRIAHHLLLSAILGLWLVGRIRRGQGFPQTPLNLPILAAVVIWVVSAIASIDPRMAFENLWFPLIHILFFFILIDRLQRGQERLVMETVFLISALVVLISGLELASWYFGMGVIPGTQTGWFDVIGTGAWLPLNVIRLSLAMNISTLLAGFVAPLVTIAATWAISTKRRDYRIVLWILAVSLLIVLILTFSRGGLLSILTAVGAFGVLRIIQMPRVTGRIPSRILAGIAIFAGVTAVSFYVIFSITQARAGNRGDVGRVDMWVSAVEMTRDRPITGVGAGVYGRAFRSYRDPTIVQDKLASAHNAYLNTLAETGLPGILVSLWLGGAFTWAWYQNWRNEKLMGQEIRLEGAFAALLGIGVHSMVDVFTITPIVLLILVLTAFCITPSTYLLQPDKRRFRVAAPAIALVVVAGYGAWLLRLDQAQSQYLNSFRNPDESKMLVEQAVEIDPHLNLYKLQLAYLAGQETSTHPAEAIAAYENALALEPTWDIGWINLAYLRLQSGDETGALEALGRARSINTHNLAAARWAELAERLDAASPEAIVKAYLDAMLANPVLPLSDFWWESELRQAAVERYLEDQPIDAQYRVLRAHEPQRAYLLVPETPQTGAEWWVVGEHALTVENDPQKAAEAFDEAIARARTNGDYYASRARASWESDPTAAQRDLDIARLLGTVNEYPNAIRAEMAINTEETETLLANALPPRTVLQEFAAALYGRPAGFDVFPEMRGIGPGRAAMQPWYTIAETRLGNGDVQGAARAYRAILDYAPDEQEAKEALIDLGA